ncbi:MAG TPA: nuclear transport factor 2 family protein [Blastocatellia bacterium]|nr:nuclear transport factor 2 family protein [Blastocatellia bacterium]
MVRQVRALAVMMVVGVGWLAYSRPTFPYPSYLLKARKYGARDCSFCHADAAGGNSWNERGLWLIREKERRRAEDIDADWLAEYKPGASDESSSDKKNFIAPPVVAGGPDDDPLNLHAQWVSAHNPPDRERLARLIADDFLATTAEGTTLTKEQAIARILQMKPESVRAEDVVARYYGPVAVIRARWIVESSSAPDQSGNFRSTEVWVKQDGVWRIVSLHLSRIR